MQVAKIDLKGLDFLIDVDLVKFSNDGLKIVFNRLKEILENNEAKNYLEQNEITEESIKFHNFQKISLSKKDYSLLSDEEKNDYMKFWLNRLVYFSKIDYMWDENTYKAENLLVLNGNYIDEQSNIEILGSAYVNGLYVNKAIVSTSPLTVVDERVINEERLEKYNTLKYKLPEKNMSLIATERDEQFYIKKINMTNDWITLVSVIDDLNKMDEKVFLKILLLSQDVDGSYIEQEDLRSVFLKFLADGGKLLSYSSGESFPYSEVLGYRIAHRDSVTDDILKILHQFNIRLSTIVFEEFNKDPAKDIKITRIAIDNIKNLTEKLVLIPELEFNIDPRLSGEIILNKDIMKNKNVSIKKDKVIVKSEEDFVEFKELFKNTLKNVPASSINILFDEMKDDFSYNNMTVSRTSLAFSLYKLYEQYTDNVDEVLKIKQHSASLALLQHTNSINSYISTLNHFVLAEMITEFDKLSLRDKMIAISPLKNRNALLVKLLHENWTTKISIRDLNLSIRSFYQEETEITLETRLKAEEILNLLCDTSNFTDENIARVFKLAKDSEKTLAIVNNFYPNVLKDDDLFTYISFNKPNDVQKFYDLKEIMIERRVERYDINSIEEKLVGEILKCFLRNNLSYDFIEKFIDTNEHLRALEKINIEDCFNYLNINKMLKAKKIEPFYKRHSEASNNEKYTMLMDLVNLTNNKVFSLVKSNLSPNVSKWLSELYDDKDWVNETSIKDKEVLIKGLTKLKILEEGMFSVIVRKESSHEIQLLCLEHMYSDIYKFHEMIYAFTKKDKIFTEIENEEMFYKNIKEVSYVRDKTLNSILALMKNKEDVFIDFFKRIIYPGHLEFNLNNLSKNLFNSENKRLFKRLISVVDHEKMAEDIGVEEALSVGLKKLSLITNFFNTSFREDKAFIQNVAELSKVVQKEINETGILNDKIKENLLQSYVLLPNQLSKLAVDKMSDGKLLHVVISEINLVDKVKDTNNTDRSKKKL